MELLKNAVQGAPNAKGYLIDGFPRCLDQGLMFEEIVSCRQPNVAPYSYLLVFI